MPTVRVGRRRVKLPYTRAGRRAARAVRKALSRKRSVSRKYRRRTRRSGILGLF